MNYKTALITDEQYIALHNAMHQGSAFFKPNIRICEALETVANLGIRIGDVLKLKPSSFVRYGEKYKINIIEQKTKKPRFKDVNKEFYMHLKKYWEANGITKDGLIFPVSERTVQQYLKKVCDYLGYENISTHSYRKYCGTNLYRISDHDVILVMEFYQHSSPDVTKRYIGLDDCKMTNVIENYVRLV